jgi:hypothetical protein
MPSKTDFSNYNPSSNLIKSIREREQAEKVRKEKWQKEFKKMRDHATTKLDTDHYYNHVLGSITSSTITSNNISNSAITINSDPTNGGMRVDVPLVVNGRDVMKELDEMRDSLLLLKRDVDMEAKYPRLRELKDEYERALEKYKTFDTIKDSS